MDKQFTDSRYTLLMMAAEAGSLDTVQNAIQTDSVHAKNTVTNIQNGNTALALAVKHSHLAVTEYLLEHSANVNTRNNSGLTPLALACSNMWEQGLLLLLKYGADVNSYDKRGWTPLIIAAFRDSEQIVKILINHGADIQHRDTFGKQAVDRAKSQKIKKLLKEEIQNIPSQGVYKGNVTLETPNHTLKEFLQIMIRDGKNNQINWKVSNKGKVNTPKKSIVISEKRAKVSMKRENEADDKPSKNKNLKSEECTGTSFHSQDSRLCFRISGINSSSDVAETPFNGTGVSFLSSPKSAKSQSHQSNTCTNSSPRMSDSSSSFRSSNTLKGIMKKHSQNTSSNKVRHIHPSSPNNKSTYNKLSQSSSSSNLLQSSLKSRTSLSSSHPKLSLNSPKSSQSSFKLPSIQPASAASSLPELKAQLIYRADSSISRRLNKVYDTSQTLASQELTAKLSNFKQDMRAHLSKSLDIMQSRILSNISNILLYTSNSLSTVSFAKDVKKVREDSLAISSSEEEEKFLEDDAEVSESHSLIAIPKSLVTKLDI